MMRMMSSSLSQPFGTWMISIALVTRPPLGRARIKRRTGSRCMILGASQSILAWRSNTSWSCTHLTSIGTDSFRKLLRSSEWMSPDQLPYQSLWSFPRRCKTKNSAIWPYIIQRFEALRTWLWPHSPMLYIPWEHFASRIMRWALCLW